MEKTNQNKDDEKLIRFWNNIFTLSKNEKEELHKSSVEGWKDHAPSEKLFQAATELGRCKKVLDYGCGSGWAGIIAAKSGCPDVTAADAAKEALRITRCYASIYGVDHIIHTAKADQKWLASIPDREFDGLICSNVLDVIPEETALAIIREFARIVSDDAKVVIGMNYYLSEEEAAVKGFELIDHKYLYVDGILRMASRTDEEWIKIFSPYFSVECLGHFAWPEEQNERRRLFYLKKVQ